MIDAIVLAGGFGTRLALVVPDLPKVLAPIQGVPFLRLLLERLSESGIVTRVVLALGYGASSVQKFIEMESIAQSLDIQCALEPSPLGTGGALLYATPQTRSETVLVLNGDSFADLSFAELFRSHSAKQGDVTIACHQVDDCSRYGSLDFNAKDLRIASFAEKKKIVSRGWISSGVYCIQRALLAPLTPNPCSLERDLFPKFLSQRAFAYPHEGTFIDIGTPQSYEMAQTILQPWIHE